MSNAEQLSHQLRFASDDVLQRRRMVAGLTLLTLSSMGVMTLINWVFLSVCQNLRFLGWMRKR